MIEEKRSPSVLNSTIPVSLTEDHVKAQSPPFLNTAKPGFLYKTTIHAKRSSDRFCGREVGLS
jgi:hypothetical protein